MRLSPSHERTRRQVEQPGEAAKTEARFKPRRHGDSAGSAVKAVQPVRFGSHERISSPHRAANKKWRKRPSPAGAASSRPQSSTAINCAIRPLHCPASGSISPPPHQRHLLDRGSGAAESRLKNVQIRRRASQSNWFLKSVSALSPRAFPRRTRFVLSSGTPAVRAPRRLTLHPKHAGLPWELALAEAQQVLLLNDLRSRIRVQTTQIAKPAAT